MPAWPARSTTSWFAGSTAIPPAPGGWSSIRELVEELFAGEEAWIVGGAVRDEALDRPIVDVDVAVAAPERAARRYARASGGAPFPLSERHGAWRVALDDGRTVDFTPLTGPIGDDLATRDFSINAIAERAGTGESVDPFNGYDDLAAKRLRAIGESVFRDDPLRLLRGPRLEDELSVRPPTGEYAHDHRHVRPQVPPSNPEPAGDNAANIEGAKNLPRFQT